MRSEKNYDKLIPERKTKHQKGVKTMSKRMDKKRINRIIKRTDRIMPDTAR